MSLAEQLANARNASTYYRSDEVQCIFGREVLVTRSDTGWEVFYPGEGKRRPALDIPIPPDTPEAEIEQYLGDLCREWATERHPSVRRLEE